MRVMPKKKKRTGIWFYGCYVGKTFASKRCAKLTQNAFLIDGDLRQLISFDLGYSKADRTKQLQRVYGLAKLAILNSNFPVISTVMMNNEIIQACDKIEFLVQIERPLDQVYEARPIYSKSRNVVGKDIFLENLNTDKIFTTGDHKFIEVLQQYVKNHQIFSL